MDDKSPVRVRFAPSPTGQFHIGGARTALFNWLFARQHGGNFILRLEDTDKERSKPEYESVIYDSLKWLGINWDEGPDIGGPFGPYRQSERLSLYQKYLQQLLDEGKAYYCYCAEEELEAERQALLAQGLPPKYGGHCRDIKEPPADKSPQVIRFRTPEGKVEFKDLIRGKVSFDAGLFGDLVIAKNLNAPLYNFANVIDDETMQITHVIRGEEHLSNTPKQILLQKALGFDSPIYAHVPLILNADRSKLSKRYAETSLLQYRDNGYLPQAVANFIVLMGWHSKTDREIFATEELIKEFDLKRVQKAGAVFNQEKLDWLNREYLRKMSPKEISIYLKSFLEEKNVLIQPEFLEKVIETERERMTTFKDFYNLADFFFELPEYDANLLSWQEEPLPKIKEILNEVLKILENLKTADFMSEKVKTALVPLTDKEGRGNVLWPLRVAVSGKAASPDPFQIIEILGKKETIRRIEVALAKLHKLF